MAVIFHLTLSKAIEINETLSLRNSLMLMLFHETLFLYQNFKVKVLSAPSCH